MTRPSSHSLLPKSLSPFYDPRLNYEQRKGLPFSLSLSPRFTIANEMGVVIRLLLALSLMALLVVVVVIRRGETVQEATDFFHDSLFTKGEGERRRGRARRKCTHPRHVIATVFIIVARSRLCTAALQAPLSFSFSFEGNSRVPSRPTPPWALQRHGEERRKISLRISDLPWS